MSQKCRYFAVYSMGKIKEHRKYVFVGKGIKSYKRGAGEKP